jgi:hypothetical protein
MNRPIQEGGSSCNRDPGPSRHRGTPLQGDRTDAHPAPRDPSVLLEPHCYICFGPGDRVAYGTEGGLAIYDCAKCRGEEP